MRETGKRRGGDGNCVKASFMSDQIFFIRGNRDGIKERTV